MHVKSLLAESFHTTRIRETLQFWIFSGTSIAQKLLINAFMKPPCDIHKIFTGSCSISEYEDGSWPSFVMLTLVAVPVISSWISFRIYCMNRIWRLCTSQRVSVLSTTSLTGIFRRFAIICFAAATDVPRGSPSRTPKFNSRSNSVCSAIVGELRCSSSSDAVIEALDKSDEYTLFHTSARKILPSVDAWSTPFSDKGKSLCPCY